MEDFFTDYGSTTVKLSNIVTNVRDTPSRLECHWCCFYHSLKSSDCLWLNKARDCGIFFDQTLSDRGRPRRTSRIWKTKRSHLSQFPKVLFFVNLLISLTWLVTIALTQGYKLLVFVCFLQVSVHRWHAWGFAAWKEGEIVVLINFFMFVISVLLALDEVAYD